MTAVDGLNASSEYHIETMILPRRCTECLWTTGLCLLLLAAGPTALADTVPLEQATGRVLALEGKDRVVAQQQFMNTYREQWPRFAQMFREAPSLEEQKFYVWALGEAGFEEACDDAALIASMLPPDAEPTLQMATANANGRCGFFAPLRQILENGAAVLRAKAAIQLGLAEDAASRPIVAELAQNPEFERYRVFFNLALGLYGDESQKELLVSLLRQVDARVYAAIALGRMGEESVVHDLQMALSDPEPAIRLHALRALVALRVAGTAPSVRALTDDPDPRVRSLAEWAVRRINRRPGSP